MRVWRWSSSLSLLCRRSPKSVKEKSNNKGDGRLKWNPSSAAASFFSTSIHVQTSTNPSPIPTDILSTHNREIDDQIKIMRFDVPNAIHLVRSCAVAGYDETVQVHINLNIDSRKADQIVRGTAHLPFGTGKAVTVAVFAMGEKALEAKNAGADIVGGQDLVDRILKGSIDFNRCIATPDMMSVVGKVARILGPRGLMPNTKVGTVTMNLADAIKSVKQGEVEYKSNKAGTVHSPIGKASFSPSQLEQNAIAFISSVLKAKPSALKTKSHEYIQSSFIHSSKGPSIRLDTKRPPFTQTRNIKKS